MTDAAKERFDASASRNHDALQKLLDSHTTTAPDLATQLAASLRQMIATTQHSSAPAQGHSAPRLLKYHSFDEQRRFSTQLLEALTKSRTPVRGFTLVEERVTHDRGGFILTVSF